MRRKESFGRKQDWFILLLGFWLFISPWIIVYPADSPIATSNTHLMGAGFIVFSACAIYFPQMWEEWFIALFGIWMAISPWVLDYSDHVPQTVHSIVVGIAAVMLAVWAMKNDESYKRWRRRH